MQRSRYRGWLPPGYPRSSSFCFPLDWLSPFQVFDVGVRFASVNGLSGKLRFAYRTYMRYIDMLRETGSPPYAVKVVIPDDWEIDAHIKLARAWLGSEERRLLIDRLTALGVNIQEILVVRRVLSSGGVDLSPFREFLGRGLLYGIPLHISNALVDSNIRCSAHPNACVQHAGLIVDALSGVDEKAEFHLMGPPISGVLTKLMGMKRVVSADTTSHRVDIKHMRIEGVSILASLAKYLGKNLVKAKPMGKAMLHDATQLGRMIAC